MLLEGVDERGPGRDGHLCHLLVREALEVADEGPEGVAVRNDEDSLSLGNQGGDLAMPELHDPHCRIGEGLGNRYSVRVHQVSVPSVLGHECPVRVVVAHRWGPDMVPLAPPRDEITAVLFLDARFRQALERTVVALVQLPPWADIHPRLAARLEGETTGHRGALEYRAEHHVELEPPRPEDLPGLTCLLPPHGRQGHVAPPREHVVLVESRLAVPHHHQ
mmetsp:Transcript_17274/g.50373  ORF Transcript_17274/g.50373 Transcript_17274/m.50373 type:complete len:220 (-) Transcript_17274:395-1054(-)